MEFDIQEQFIIFAPSRQHVKVGLNFQTIRIPEPATKASDHLHKEARAQI
jgi:hypothetical protein